MNQGAFESQNASTWRAYDDWIRVLSGKRTGPDAQGVSLKELATEFPAAYRKICHHLALARARRYSLELENRLNQMALEGHQHLYRSRPQLFGSILRFFSVSFPAAFRREWRCLLISALAFYGPGLAMGLAVQIQPELAFSVVDAQSIAQIETMYDPANSALGRERQSDTDVYMFGFYIYNNISIGFQTFAGGLVFGLGTLFYLCFNGLYIGTVASHLTSIEYSHTFWSFVSGHSAFELTGIVIFGGAGLMMGYAAIAPGSRSRWHAIRDRAVEGLPLVVGGTLMLVAAAFVEAFWSSTTWPSASIKYAVGGVLWLSVGLYFWLFGRHES